MGVKLCYVTLHVGLGTFRPVKEEEIADHEMHSEYCVIPQETADIINRDQAQRWPGDLCGHHLLPHPRELGPGGRHCRPPLEAGPDIFIYPGYKFKVMDALVTNFHLPESTLIMLVSALAGREHILAAYEEAVREKYRFFSFGDAMFIY